MKVEFIKDYVPTKQELRASTIQEWVTRQTGMHYIYSENTLTGVITLTPDRPVTFPLKD